MSDEDGFGEDAVSVWNGTTYIAVGCMVLILCVVRYQFREWPNLSRFVMNGAADDAKGVKWRSSSDLTVLGNLTGPAG